MRDTYEDESMRPDASCRALIDSGKLPLESEGLGPHGPVAGVDEVSGPGGVLQPDFVPTRPELVALYCYWWRRATEMDLFQYTHDQVGSDWLRILSFARRRMATLSDFIGAEDEARANVDGLADTWTQGHHVEPFDVEVTLAAPNGPQRDGDGTAKDDRPWFKRWSRPLLDAVAAEVRWRGVLHMPAGPARSAAWDPAEKELKRAFDALVEFVSESRKE